MPAGSAAARATGWAMCAPASTVALYPAWSSNRIAAAWTTWPELRDQPDGDGRGDEHGRRDDHGERGPLLARFRLAGLLGGHLGHLRVLAGRVAEAVEHAARDPQHGTAGQDGAGDEDRP